MNYDIKANTAKGEEDKRRIKTLGLPRYDFCIFYFKQYKLISNRDCKKSKDKGVTCGGGIVRHSGELELTPGF